MELILLLSSLGLAFIFAFVIFHYNLLWFSNCTKKGCTPPMVAGSWPIVGHLRLLGGPQLPHVVLGALADKYGPIFTIRLGARRALVVSSWEIAKECFTKNDKIFSNRPRLIALEHMSYNFAMFGFSPYGPYWREIRRIATVELLSNHRLATLGHLRESVVKSSIKNTYVKWVEKRSAPDKAVFEMKRWFGDITMDTIFRIVAGKSFKELGKTAEGEQCRKALRDFFKLSGVFTVGDSVPFLRWLDFGGYEKEMEKVGKELDRVLSGWLEEHKQKRMFGKLNECGNDFMGVMLSILDGATYGSPTIDADTINKSTCLALVLGATDTTTITLTWAIALLLNNPWALKKAQDELDKYVGRGRQLKESDIKNLAYLQAIVKETLRLYPPGQLIPPREASEGCYVGGYHVPAGTRLIVNLWKIHHDPRVWPDPMEFQPERFLTTHKDIDVWGQNFELLPFGSGRRVCPGISFSLQVVHFTLASLLHSFEVETASGEVVDMTENLGMTSDKAKPLEVLLTPRLPAQLYE